jgi:hypothetical protein
VIFGPVLVPVRGALAWWRPTTKRTSNESRHADLGRTWDGPVAHSLANGSLVRTVACPVPQSAQHRLRGARAGTAGPPLLPGPLTVTRRVCVRGAIMIGGQRIQAGLPRAGQAASITIGSGTCQITVPERLTMTAPRTTSRDIVRHKASNSQQ